MKNKKGLPAAAIFCLLCGCGADSAPVPAPPSAQSARSVNDVREFLDYVGESIVGGSVDARWSEDGSGFWFVGRDGADRLLHWYELGDERRHTVIRIAAVRQAMADAGEPVAEDDVGIRSYDRESGEAVVTAPDKRAFTVRIAGDGVEILGRVDAAARPRMVRASFPIAGWDRHEIPSPDGRTYASLSDRNFALRDPESDEPRVLTDDGSDTFEYLFAADLWESSGSPWSGDGRYVVARSHDMRGVAGIPIVDYLSTPETVSRFRYWARAGQPLPLTAFHVFDSRGGKALSVAASGDDQHFAFFVDWSPDGAEFAYLRYARDLTTLELIVVDVATGSQRTLLRETRDDGWVKWPGGAQTVTYLPSGDGFLWRSDRSGFFRYYLYRRDGTLVRAVTDDGYSAGSIVGIDEQRDWLYFMAPGDRSRPYDTHLNRTRLSAVGGDQRLTQDAGQHRVSLSPDKQWFVAEHSHLDRPPRSDLYSADGRFVETLSESVVDSARSAWPAPEEFVATGADGVTDIHGLIMKPHGFDAGRKYPVVERIYGGMQSQAVRRGFVGHRAGRPGSEYHTMLEYLRSQGYVVIVMDAPGTPGRGRAFNLRTHGSWPDGIIDDHAAVMRQLLARHAYMDATRVGIEGNSWGGQLAVRGLIDAPQLYRAASATVPETDLLDHAHWIEFQNGTPKDNPAAYRNGTPALVERIDGELLLIHGTSDVNVPVSNTMKLLDALMTAGKDYELVIVPGVNHSLQGNGDRYGYAVYRIARFFDRALGPTH